LATIHQHLQSAIIEALVNNAMLMCSHFEAIVNSLPKDQKKALYPVAHFEFHNLDARKKIHPIFRNVVFIGEVRNILFHQNFIIN
jgi:hypothetical protein